MDCLGDQPEVTIPYFKKDERKSGGAYLTITGIVKSVDEYERVIIMQDKSKISMDDVYVLTQMYFLRLNNALAMRPKQPNKSV